MGAFGALGGGKASEGEAQAVARAIGLNEKALGARDVDGGPLSRTQSVRSVGTEESPSPEGPLVVDEEGLEDVPEMEELGSPVGSEGEDEDGPAVEELSLGETEEGEGKGKGRDV